MELEQNCTDWRANIKGKYAVGFRDLKLRRIRFEKIGRKKFILDAPSSGIFTRIKNGVLEWATEHILTSYFNEAFLKHQVKYMRFV